MVTSTVFTIMPVAEELEGLSHTTYLPRLHFPFCIFLEVFVKPTAFVQWGCVGSWGRWGWMITLVVPTGPRQHSTLNSVLVSVNLMSRLAFWIQRASWAESYIKIPRTTGDWKSRVVQPMDTHWTTVKEWSEGGGQGEAGTMSRADCEEVTFE